jgi:hypothetical protein
VGRIDANREPLPAQEARGTQAARRSPGGATVFNPRKREPQHRTHQRRKEGDLMLKLAVVIASCCAALLMAAVATADAQEKTRGSFGTSCSWHCWGDGDLVENLRGRDVWCRWDGDHVSIHLTLRNDSDHRVVATIKPSYWIHGHGRHGSSLHSLKNIEIDGNSTISWTGDAGTPDNTPIGAHIQTCKPSLYTIRRN